MNDYIVTEIEFDDRTYLAAALVEDMHLTALKLYPREEESLIGRIYLGHIDSYAENIGGAFVAFGKEKCFLSKYKKGSCDPGRIPVHIIKDASGNKVAAATMKLKLSGRYVVFSAGDGNLSFSRKLTVEQKDLLRKWLRDTDISDCSVLLRTNAAGATKAAAAVATVPGWKARTWGKRSAPITAAPLTTARSSIPPTTAGSRWNSSAAPAR